MKALFAQPAIVVLVALAMSALAGLEHGFAPWRPFYLTYAALCILLPLWIGMQLKWAPLGWLRWACLIILVFALQFGLGWLVSSAAPAALSVAGVPETEINSPAWRIGLALPRAIAAYAPHWNIEPAAMLLAYVSFITLWAGIGEEFFYRGYVQEKLRAWGVGVAIFLSALLFAARHAVQLQGPDYPWGAAAIWLTMCFVLGLVFSALYEWRRSIWPPVIAHIAFNLIPFAQMLSALLAR